MGRDGFEVVVLYDVPTLASGGVFHTDSNGRQFVRRVRDERDSFTLTQEDLELEPVSANYYPVTTGTYFVKTADLHGK